MSESAEPRKRWGLPALAFLLTVSLVFGPLPSAMSLAGAVDHPARYSACVAAATEPAGFRDMVGNFAEGAANCLAHYGITYGTESGMFSPRDVIPRWQMALFLQRAARPAGIVLPRAKDQGFTDLGSFASHIQAGINQMAALGIMPGITGTTYGPAEPVTRQGMALLLAKFLEVAPTGPGGTGISSVRPDDDQFKDLDEVTFSTTQAIAKLYELGVTSGVTADTFNPDGWVTRAQMAVFITRMLAHTNARPAGLAVQFAGEVVVRDTTFEVSVTLRSTSHQPIANRAVDVFTAEDPKDAFDKKGSCTTDATAAIGAGECAIDRADPTTDTGGNLLADVEVGDVEALRIWVWSGKQGELFNANTSRFATLDVITRGVPSALLVRDDLPSSAVKAAMGEAVTFTFQLVDDKGDPVSEGGVPFVVVTQEIRDGGRRVESTTLNKTTGPDGSAQATFLSADPSDELGDMASLDLDVRPGGDLDVLDKTTIGIVKDDGKGNDPTLVWTDERAEPSTLRLMVVQEYIVASSAGNGAAATVQATLSDQYGRPAVGEDVVFSSNDSLGVPNGVRRTTDSQGLARLNYQRDSDKGLIERITGSYKRLASTARQYWVTRNSGAVSGSGTVRVVDTDENTVIVVSGSEILLVEYDDRDQFYIGSKAVNYTNFEDNLSTQDILAYRITDTLPRTVNLFTLTNR